MVYMWGRVHASPTDCAHSCPPWKLNNESEQKDKRIREAERGHDQSDCFKCVHVNADTASLFNMVLHTHSWTKTKKNSD